MKRILSSIIVSAFPIIALAQYGYKYTPDTGIGGLLILVGSWLGMVLPIIIALAVVWFIFNVFKYTIVNNEEDKTQAKSQMIWGIFGIFVMVSVWGFVAILQSTFRTNVILDGSTIKSLFSPFNIK